MRATAVPLDRRLGAFAWRRYALLLVGGFLVLCVLAAALFAEVGGMPDLLDPAIWQLTVW